MNHWLVRILWSNYLLLISLEVKTFRYGLIQTIIEVYPFGLVKMKGFEPLTRRLKACCSTN